MGPPVATRGGSFSRFELQGSNFRQVVQESKIRDSSGMRPPRRGVWTGGKKQARLCVFMRSTMPGLVVPVKRLGAFVRAKIGTSAVIRPEARECTLAFTLIELLVGWRRNSRIL